MLRGTTRRLMSVTILVGVLSTMTHYCQADTFTVTSQPAGVQTPNGITGTYETFDGSTYSNGVSSVTGTYTGSFSLVSADAYGGAGGTGLYIRVASLSSYTLTLNASANYFGLWISALDSGNQLQFYNGNTLVSTFLPSNYAQLVGACPTSASQPNYCGNPNANFYNQDAAEQFAYLNFYDLSGTFNKVVFTETALAGGGIFESDNQTAALLVNGTPVSGTPLATTPEPASWIFCSIGLCCMLAFSNSTKHYKRTSSV